ncbi:hypothetical protein CDCA_CDCA12G3517 [Cyanidium caldarium]|uniref:UBC core domain-containing protein n=1 Tax=Cyanidium caldarium TaxID=2771 RepID=A0AAV9IYX0_CYACA|nr:hypothetical protein CDCA_CDCA12G3517 [Cyanidium caldarium]
MSSPGKRREMDLMKLLMADYEVEMANEDSAAEFYVKFRGPRDTPYEGGVWKVHVELPEAYPYKSPSIGFVNAIYHPNIDQMSGSVCLDVINQTWSPMFDLLNVFEVFLPQLLTYPNSQDPLNGEAAALQLREPLRFQQKVREFVNKYAREEDYPACSRNRLSTAMEEAARETPAQASMRSRATAVAAAATSTGAAAAAARDDDDGSDLASLSDSDDEDRQQQQQEAQRAAGEHRMELVGGKLAANGTRNGAHQA